MHSCSARLRGVVEAVARVGKLLVGVYLLKSERESSSGPRLRRQRGYIDLAGE
jgi:hypothetical protein